MAKEVGLFFARPISLFVQSNFSSAPDREFYSATTGKAILQIPVDLLCNKDKETLAWAMALRDS